MNQDIDWTDPAAAVTAHFTVKDCLWLGRWNRLANEKDGLTDDIKIELIRNCLKMEEIRTILGCAMNVHSMFRPPEYSVLVGGSMTDVHVKAQAWDYDCLPTLTIEQVRAKLLSKLQLLNIRMEQGTDTWIHNDRRAPGPSGRHFLA